LRKSLVTTTARKSKATKQRKIQFQEKKGFDQAKSKF